MGSTCDQSCTSALVSCSVRCSHGHGIDSPSVGTALSPLSIISTSQSHLAHYAMLPSLALNLRSSCLTLECWDCSCVHYKLAQK